MDRPQKAARSRARPGPTSRAQVAGSCLGGPALARRAEGRCTWQGPARSPGSPSVRGPRGCRGNAPQRRGLGRAGVPGASRLGRQRGLHASGGAPWRMCWQPWEAGAGVELRPRNKYSVGTGAGHSRSSFLIPGPVGVVGPRRSTAAATSDLLTVSWGTRASCRAPRPGPGPQGPC